MYVYIYICNTYMFSTCRQTMFKKTYTIYQYTEHRDTVQSMYIGE